MLKLRQEKPLHYILMFCFSTYIGNIFYMSLLSSSKESSLADLKRIRNKLDFPNVDCSVLSSLALFQ